MLPELQRLNDAQDNYVNKLKGIIQTLIGLIRSYGPSEACEATLRQVERDLRLYELPEAKEEAV